jgi:hypothetical protein
VTHFEEYVPCPAHTQKNAGLDKNIAVEIGILRKKRRWK